MLSSLHPALCISAALALTKLCGTAHVRVPSRSCRRTCVTTLSCKDPTFPNHTTSTQMPPNEEWELFSATWWGGHWPHCCQLQPQTPSQRAAVEKECLAIKLTIHVFWVAIPPQAILHHRNRPSLPLVAGPAQGEQPPSCMLEFSTSAIQVQSPPPTWHTFQGRPWRGGFSALGVGIMPGWQIEPPPPHLLPTPTYSIIEAPGSSNSWG